jgi:hypothetical protein
MIPPDSSTLLKPKPIGSVDINCCQKRFIVHATVKMQDGFRRSVAPLLFGTTEDELIRNIGTAAAIATRTYSPEELLKLDPHVFNDELNAELKKSDLWSIHFMDDGTSKIMHQVRLPPQGIKGYGWQPDKDMPVENLPDWQEFKKMAQYILAHTTTDISAYSLF